MVLVNKGITLGQLARRDEELAVYDGVVAFIGDDAGPGLRVQMVKALLSRAIALVELDRPDEALAAYDDVVARFGEDLDPDEHEYVREFLGLAPLAEDDRAGS